MTIHLASRLEKLGGETAFAVSLAAADWASKGNKVYPFHLGDINIPTPRHIMDAAYQAMRDGKTGYVPAAGIAPLRAALAEDVGSKRGVAYAPENVSVQMGGKPVIGKFLQVMMNPGDEVLYPSPGYPIYESQIDYYGGVAKPYRYIETPTGFALDRDFLEAQITPKTRLIFFNNCQNPLAAESDEAEIDWLAGLILKHNLWVLSDDAYAEMRFSGVTDFLLKRPGLQDRVVTLYTYSKKFAMTGWRLGAAIGPTPVIEGITRINGNDESCSPNFIQWAGVAALKDSQDYLPGLIETLRIRRDAAVDLLNAIPGVSVARPASTFYLFPNVTEAMRAKGFDDVNAFATAALHATGVSFCTRKHFGRPQPGEQQHYIRLAYSGINVEDIREGLVKLARWLS
jgi:aspartate aminotransferase